MKISRRRKHRNHPKRKRRSQDADRSEATQGVISNPNTQKLPEVIQGGEAKTRKTIERGGDLKVNQSRPRLLNHLHYVGRPERTRWLREPVGTAPVEVVYRAGGRGSLVGP